MGLQTSQLHQKNLKELKDLLKEYRGELYLLKFQNSTGQLETTHKVKLVRRDIARILTTINQKLKNKIQLPKNPKKINKKTENEVESLKLSSHQDTNYQNEASLEITKLKKEEVVDLENNSTELETNFNKNLEEKK